MKIIRNGKEYELTGNELFNAYLEQEHLFDVQNIEENMESYLTEEEYEALKDCTWFKDNLAYELRHLQDKKDYSYEDALYEVFKKFHEGKYSFEQDFIEIMKDASRFVKGELELDLVDGEWFAMDYREDLEGAFYLNGIYHQPIITKVQAKLLRIDVAKCCDEFGCSYVG